MNTQLIQRAYEAARSKFRPRQDQQEVRRIVADKTLEGLLSKASIFLQKCLQPTQFYRGASDDVKDLYHAVVGRDLLRIFDVRPDLLIREDIIPVFDPGFFTNRDVVDVCLNGQGVAVTEHRDIMDYTGSEATMGPSLHLISSAQFPALEDMGKSADELEPVAHQCLSLRGYCLAQAFYRYISGGKYLDDARFGPGKCLFPANRLSSPSPTDTEEVLPKSLTAPVAYGFGDSNENRLEFRYHFHGGYSTPDLGARAVYNVPILLSCE